MVKLLKRNGIEIYCSQNTPKSCTAERFIRTLRDMIEKCYAISHSTVWLHVLPKLIEDYNHCYHRSIDMSPIEAGLKKNYKRVYKKLYVTSIDQNTDYMSNAVLRQRMPKWNIFGQTFFWKSSYCVMVRRDIYCQWDSRYHIHDML